MAGGSTFTWQHALLLHSTKSPFDSPVPQTHKAFADVQPVSWERKNIAGTLVTIYGQRELPPHPSDITCLWLLHGRGDTQDSMGFCAAAFLHAWNAHRQRTPPTPSRSSPSSPSAHSISSRGLLVITFDQRNHGSRMVENGQNLAWSQGNPTHGPDMFGAYVGSARDLSLLITLLPAYLPSASSSSSSSTPGSPLPLRRHICGGVSLGGHATWVALVTEPRIAAGLVVVGCPDYVRLMRDRATRGKRASASATGTRTENFVGSEDFPPSLVAAVRAYDPAGILTGIAATEEELRTGLATVTAEEKEAARARLGRTLQGKKILCLSGAKDRLVPYAQGAPFLSWLKKGVEKDNGWAGDLGIEVEDVVDPEGRHEFSALMRREAERWLCELLSRDEPTAAPPRDSKI